MAMIMPCRKFIYVAVQMLTAHFMVDAMIASLEQRPKGFDAVCMRHVTNILPDRMAH